MGSEYSKGRYVIPFLRNPLLSPTPLNLTFNHPSIPEALAQLLKGAVETVSNPNSGILQSSLLGSQGNGSWRPLIDRSTLNNFVDFSIFQMETSFDKSIHSTQRLDFFFGSDGCLFSRPDQFKSQKYLPFCVGTRYFKFWVLPFRILTALRVFTKLLHTVAAHLRLKGSILL